MNSSQSDQKRIQQLEKELAEAKSEIGRLNRSIANNLQKHDIAQDYDDPEHRESYFKLIADNLPVRILHISKDMVIRFANKSCFDISLLPAEQMVGSRLLDVIGEDMFNQLTHAYNKVLSGETLQLEFVFANEATNGESYSTTAHYIPEWENGEVVGFFSVGIDITEHREAEAKLTQTSKQLKIIADNLPAWISYIDKNIVFQYVNKFYETTTGIKVEDLIGMPLSEAFSKEAYDASEPYYDLALKGNRVSAEREVPASDHQEYQSVVLTLIPDITENGVQGFYALGVDQTETKLARAQEKKGYELLQALINHIPARVGYIDKNDTYRFANPMYKNIIDMPVSQIAGKTTTELFSSRVVSETQEHFDRALAGEIISFEFDEVTNRDEIRHISCSYFPNYVDGEVDGVFVYSIDVTNQKRLQKRLEDALSELTLLQDTMPVATSVYDADLNYVKVNQKHLALIEMSEDQVIGKHLSEIITVPSNFEYVKKHFEKALRGETVSFYFDRDLNHVPPYRLQVQIAPIISNQQIIGLQTIEVDVTELHMAQKNLYEHNEIFNAVSNVAPIGIFKTDNQGETIWVNEQATKIIGLKPEECLGLGWQNNLYPEDKIQISEDWNIRYKLDGFVRAESRFQHADGRLVWAIGEARPVYTISGKPDGHIGILFDISDIQVANNEIKELNQELQSINASLEKRVAARTRSLNEMNVDLSRTVEELDRFAHIAAHDLKEPLRGLQTYATMLSDDYSERLSNDGKALIQSMQELAIRSEALLDDLRVYSRIGRKREAVRSIDLNDILSQALALLSPFIAKTSPKIVKVNPLPTIFYQRSHALTIFQNLISNGIKYNLSQDKTIRIGQVTPKYFPQIDLSEGAVIFIQDNGIGIEKKHQEKIFQMFKRLHPKNRYGGGTGAGLALVRKIVDFNSGKIWLDSTSGEGTTFFVQFKFLTNKVD